MTTTNSLQGYDMVVAITENALNAQIEALFLFGIIAPTIDVKLNPNIDGPALQVTEMDAPTVSLSVPNTNYRQLHFSLHFRKGTLKFFDILTGKLASHPVDGVTLSLLVDLAILPMTTLEGAAIPATTKDRLSRYISDDSFSVRRLVLDFENANFATLAVTAKDLGLEPGSIASQTISVALQAYLTNLRGSANPYVLGYAIESDPAKSQTSAPLLAPTSGQFSTTPFIGPRTDPASEGLSTLNYLLTTGGDPLPTDQRSLVFPENWVDSKGIQGVMTFRGDLFIQAYIEGLMLPAIQRSAGADVPFQRVMLSGIFGGIVPSPTGAMARWILARRSDNLDLNGGRGKRIGTDSGLLNVYLERFEGTSILVTLISDGDGIRLEGTGTFAAEGRITSYPLGFHKVRASTSSVLNFKFTIHLRAGADGKIATDIDIQQVGDVQTTQEEGFFAKLADLIVSGGFDDLTRELSSQFRTFQERRFGDLGARLDAALTSLGDTIVLPAGSVFFFRGLGFDENKNTRLILTFKTG
jgi:hypothetical protein